MLPVHHDEVSESQLSLEVSPKLLRYTHTTRSRFRFTDSWFFESMSTVASVFCQGALIAILALMDGKPLANWTAPISLGATVAILTTASKALLMFSVAQCISQTKWDHFRRSQQMFDFDIFNEASRGPLGSFQFLFRRRTLLNLGAVGALITLLAIGMDTFVQQVLRLQQKMIPASGYNARFQFSDAYDYSGAIYGQASYNANSYSPDITMQGAIMNGLYGLNVSAAFECTTSNCTWPGSYVTLGFESNCSNVTITSSRKCDFPTHLVNNNSYPIRICNITTPGNVTLQETWNMGDSRTAMDVSTTVSREGCADDIEVDCDPVGNSTNVVTFAAYRLPGVDTNDCASTNCWNTDIPWEVLECNISTVAYRYDNISVQDNQLQVGQLKKIPLWRLPVPYTSLSGAYYMNFTASDSSQNFTINFNDWKSVLDFFQSKVFNGSFMAGDSGVIPESDGLGPHALYRVDIIETASKVAMSMTERVRTGPNAIQAQGVTLHEITFVAVWWPWLTLPILTVVAAALFLLLTVL